MNEILVHLAGGPAAVSGVACSTVDWGPDATVWLGEPDGPTVINQVKLEKIKQASRHL